MYSYKFHWVISILDLFRIYLTLLYKIERCIYSLLAAESIKFSFHTIKDNEYLSPIGII